MKLLLAGGSGFIGKSIVESFDNKKLKKFKIKKIFVIARHANKFFKKLNTKKIEFIRGDLSKIKKLPNSDIAIFLAESTNIKDYKDKKIVAKKHKKTINNFCNLIKKNEKTKVLYCSSGSVYEPSNKKISEKNKLSNKKQEIKSYKSAYNSLKLYSESKVKNLAKIGIKCSIARCFTFVGRHIPLNKHYALGNFIYDGMFGKEIRVKTKKKITRSYMYADDLSLWLLTIARHSNTKVPIYNVGSDVPIEIKKLAQIIGNKFGKKVQFNNYSNKDIDNYVPNINKAKKKLKLKINYDLKESINLSISNKYEKVN
jgi:nucleoside-diphosphate-sugar epimerase